MNILLLGSGGREHALAQKISESEKCSHLWIAPGNGGTSLCGTNLPIKATDFEALKKVCLELTIEMVVVGPEDPLVKGIYDNFKNDTSTQHIQVVGPSQQAAQLEGSKAFAKGFMKRHAIPTAQYAEFTSSTLSEGINYLEQHSLPIVLKADGLAAGKGVLICQTKEEAISEFKNMLSGKFGEASAKVVVEQFLDGIEFSVFVLTDGKNYQILPVAKDYKRIGENDTGLNTGGMGAVSPVPFVNADLMDKVIERIVKPTVQGLDLERLVYEGFIFLGLIKVGEEPFVIEYNCRLGDPETEVVLPQLDNDIVELFIALKNKNLDQYPVFEKDGYSVTTVLASGGYPDDYETGKKIFIPYFQNHCQVYHAGTKQDNDDLVTSGGRVIMVTAWGNTLNEAIQLSQREASAIDFEGKYFRKDIGNDLLPFIPSNEC